MQTNRAASRVGVCHVCATKSRIVDRVENVPWQPIDAREGASAESGGLKAGPPSPSRHPFSSERCQPTPSVSRAPHRNPPLISFASNPPTVCPNPLKFDRSPSSLSLSRSALINPIDRNYSCVPRRSCCAQSRHR